ncbi:MAG: Trk system potassium transporter TrkA [Thermodesulfobacteriota bacterium]
MRAIIIGAGVVGATIAEKLAEEKHDVVIIDKDERRLKELKEAVDVRVIHGSGSSPQTLLEAGIESVDMVIAVTDSDEVNMLACLIAETQSSVPKKIARIRNQDYLSYSRIFEEGYLDLEYIINPEKVAAERILKIIEVPGAVDVVDFMDGRLKLVGTRLASESAAAGKKIEEVKGLYPGGNIIIVAIYRGSDTIIPQGSTVLQTGDLVFAMTLKDEAAKLPKLFGARKEKTVNKCLIIGGGDVGFYLAKPMEKLGYQIKIIEKNETRCAYLAEHLDKAIVIAGDGTNQELLNEENVRDTDTVIAVTNDEEANILTSLLAKRLGAKRCIALIDKPEYLSMVSTIGIDVAVSPRLASVSDILQFVRQGNILSVKALMEERIEAIETVAMETSDITGMPLKNIKLPAGAIVGAVVKDERVILPDGDTVINPSDKVVIFALRKAIPKIEKMLIVKPEFF